MLGARTEHPYGTVTEIFSFECGRLVVMKMGLGVEESSLPVWRAGDFVVNLHVQAATHIMMTTCCIEDLRWPMSRDSPVIRIGQRSFAFVILGLLYGFQLPPACDEDTVDTLERLFIKFADYTSLLYNGSNGYPCPEYQTTYWAIVRPVIEGVARAKLGRNWQLMEGNPATSLSKVVRTSVTTKTVSDALVAGFLKPMHVDSFIVKMVDQHKRYTDSEEAFSSIAAITDIVNLEMGWNARGGDRRALEDADRVGGSARMSKIKLWKLNQPGIALLLRQRSTLL